MATTIMSNAAISMTTQEEHLVLPVIAVEWPSVRENDNLASWITPVLVVDLGVIFGGDERHCDMLKLSSIILMVSI
jgi:hypothetical protein